MEGSRSLARRALMAVGLMIAFYLLGIIVAAILIWLPFAEYSLIGRIEIRFALMLWALAGGILWSLVPRADRFEAPGPLLTRASDPEVFTLIDEVARATSQAPPKEVYLLPDFNAFVTHRGGTMGMGGRRVMGIGLPLMSTLTRDELRAVIAHEFGHYVSGDVALGPWIHSTRATIGRMLISLKGSWLSTIFEWYGHMFMRVTMAVSRAQEFAADRTAARVAGEAAAVSALRKVSGLTPAFGAYIQQEVVPVLQSGYLPPVADGFRRFVSSAPVTEAIRSTARDRASEPTSDYDTHPSMSERIVALGGSPDTDIPHTDDTNPPLLANVDRHALLIIERMMSDDEFAKLKKITWEEVGDAVYAENWRKVVEAHASWYAGLTVEQLPAGRKVYAEMGQVLFEDRLVESDRRIDAAAYVMHCGLGAALLSAGWTMETSPGQPIELVHNGQRLNPRQIIQSMVESAEAAADWKVQCHALGIGDLVLCYEARA